MPIGRYFYVVPLVSQGGLETFGCCLSSRKGTAPFLWRPSASHPPPPARACPFLAFRRVRPSPRHVLMAMVTMMTLSFGVDLILKSRRALDFLKNGRIEEIKQGRGRKRLEKYYIFATYPFRKLQLCSGDFLSRKSRAERKESTRECAQTLPPPIIFVKQVVKVIP